MRILDRHVLTETATAGSAATGAFVFIMVAGNVLKDVIGAVATGRVSGGQGLEMIGLLFPGVIPYALPLGMLTGVLLAFGRMSSQHELTAMKASGRSLARIARPALIFAGALVLFSAWLNLELAPIANTEFRRLLVGSAKDNPSSIIVPGQLNRQFPGVIIRAGAREDEILKDFWLWRLDPRGNQGGRSICNTASEIPRLQDTDIVPHYLPGKNPEADFMTRTGSYLPMNRMGMTECASPFLQMSFETTCGFLTKAALEGSSDPQESPSARIVLGNVAKVGTGCFELMMPLKA